MFRKKKVQKENNVMYLFGGTVVGMAAGLLYGKLFSNTTNGNNLKSGSENRNNKGRIKYSQDDNIHNLHVTKNNCHTRSKSASRYNEKNDCTEQVTCSKELDKDLKQNLNDLDINHKYDNNIQKNVYNKALYNISIEDNSAYNLCTKIMSEEFADEKDNRCVLPKLDSIKTEHSNNNISVKDDSTEKEIHVKNVNANNSKECPQEQMKPISNTKITDTFNSVSMDFCEDLVAYKNFQKEKNFALNPDVLPDCIDNLSNMATCNSIYFTNEVEEEEEEFSAVDIISSTKRDNLGET